MNWNALKLKKKTEDHLYTDHFSELQILAKTIRFYQHAQTGVGQGTANSASNDPVILTSATSVPSNDGLMLLLLLLVTNDHEINGFVWKYIVYP